jgi:cathepsin D
MQQSYLFVDDDSDEFAADVKTTNDKPKYGYNTGSYTEKSSSATGSTQSIKLYNFKNSQYTGKIAIGEPTNTFDVIYDTGSANFWIDSSKCNDPGCLNHKRYDSSNSPTYNRMGLELDVEFGTGELEGEINQDTVYFGGVEVQSQGFSEIMKENGEIFAEVKIIL